MKNYKWMLGLSILGTAFSGYLSSVKLFSTNCVLSEGCSYFLGYPTCYYGFVFFFILLILTYMARVGNRPRVLTAVVWVAVIASIFSGYFSFVEISQMFSVGKVYSLILPSCTYGLLMYMIVGVLAWDRVKSFRK